MDRLLSPSTARDLYSEFCQKIAVSLKVTMLFSVLILLLLSTVIFGEQSQPSSSKNGAVLHPNKRPNHNKKNNSPQTIKDDILSNMMLDIDTLNGVDELSSPFSFNTESSFQFPDGTPITPCISDPSELVYIKGILSSTGTMTNCMANIADPGMLPTYSNGSYHGLTRINTTIVLNNLELVDEIQGTARLQFTLRLYWKDDRFAMPLFWERVDPSAWGVGIDITQTVMTNSDVTIWLPVIRFPDASEVNVLYQMMKLNASNIFTIFYALDVTLVQPNFNFRSYPEDSQTLVMRFVSYNFNAKYVEMGFNGGDGLIFNQYIDNSDTFKSNQIWTYESSAYYPTTGNGYSYNVYELNINRQGGGIIVRLVLPIAFLLLLSTLTFWVLYENRVDTTITIMLSVSALYIVILGNIPLVGYLTNVDKFVFWMFLLLVVVISMHQVYATLKQKVDRWPLRAIILRVIEFCGRVFILPFIVIYFLRMITFEDALFTSEALIGVTVAVSVIIAVQECFGVRVAVIRAIDALIAKVNDADTTVNDLSLAEILVLNWMQFHILSWSKLLVAKELQDKGELTRFSVAALQIKHLAQVNDLLTSSGSSSGNVGHIPSSSSPISSQRHSISVKALQNAKRDALSSAAKAKQEEIRASSSAESNLTTSSLEMKSFQRVGSTNVGMKQQMILDPFDPNTVNPLARPSSILAAVDDSDDEN